MGMGVLNFVELSDLASLTSVSSTSNRLVLNDAAFSRVRSDLNLTLAGLLAHTARGTRRVEVLEQLVNLFQFTQCMTSLGATVTVPIGLAFAPVWGFAELLNAVAVADQREDMANWHLAAEVILPSSAAALALSIAHDLASTCAKDARTAALRQQRENLSHLQGQSAQAIQTARARFDEVREARNRNAEDLVTEARLDVFEAG